MLYLTKEHGHRENVMGLCKRLLTMVLSALTCTALTPHFALAYDHPLGDDAIRKAYFIGQDVTNFNKFFSRYTQTLPVPDTGPHVAEIELSTPYAQVVENSAQHTVGYSAQQAAADYRKRGDVIAVRVRILFTPTYAGDDNFWRSVSVGLIQRGKHMAATSVSGQPIVTADPCAGENTIGAYVFVQFSVSGVESDSIQVEVVPPAGAAVHARFDLSTLR
jgi:hypothetical protein